MPVRLFFPFFCYPGLNVGGGKQICLRLRYPGDSNQFVPVEQVVDTMLHELAHNVYGPHDAKFHALWNQLRDEHEALVMKGYTGEGFLSEGRRLGGRRVPREEARRLAQAAAEKRARTQGARTAGPGQRLGGAPIRPGEDARRVIADAADRRNRTLRGCANDNRTGDEIAAIADDAARNGFRTRAEEDAANEAAIAQALWELVQEDEKARLGDAYIPPTAGNPAGSGGFLGDEDRGEGVAGGRDALPTTWTCEVCTLVNPTSYLCCDACGVARGEDVSRDLAQRLSSQTSSATSSSSSKKQRTVIDLTGSPETQHQPKQQKQGPRTQARAETASSSAAPTPQTWQCSFCGRVREKQWWTCDLCGKGKRPSPISYPIPSSQPTDTPLPPPAPASPPCL